MATAAPQTQIPRDKEHLTPAQRFGELISLVVTLLVIAYFRQLWATQAGFFTTAFGPWEQFWFFAPIVLSLAAPLTRLVVGRRNPARPIEIVASLFMVAGAIWLLRVFPFDFAHLGDALPGGLPALFNWIPNWAGRVVLVLQAFGGSIAMIATTWQFVRTGLRDWA